MSEPKGQILPGSFFGDMLTQIAKQSETIVEIGTWFGQGSTLCLANGLIRPSQRIWSFDTSSECIKEAAAFHGGETRITFIHGAISIDPGIPREMLVSMSMIPESIDLALIDGGECNGEGDFRVLYPRTKIIALDDTNNEKNCKSLLSLIEMQWDKIAWNAHDRNGWAIFRRP